MYDFSSSFLYSFFFFCYVSIKIVFRTTNWLVYFRHYMIYKPVEFRTKALKPVWLLLLKTVFSSQNDKNTKCAFKNQFRATVRKQTCN